MGRIIQIIIIISLLVSCAGTARFPNKNPNINEFVCWYYDPITLWVNNIDCEEWKPTCRKCQ